ncbi:hypothetical protein HWN40_03160 [Methanolobus zinderi]|uniref:Uncharacterized protein n=1 Tax=Methanolobus zinderi TaxID=536044 RepID=A0A7D5E7D4_9EURY|nr:hypothetical protein [Methanolobus zinderi]QLC49331.1 hypothetical protein HWN40_03160 [Methanolobus zinderi]
MANEFDSEKIEKMKEMCRTRPVLYSDLDHMKKGSTGFLYEQGYSNEEIAAALELDLHEVENNLEGTGYPLELRKVEKFKDMLPPNIGDVIKIRIPEWGSKGAPVETKASVVQYILKGESCGLIVQLLEDVDTGYPIMAEKKKNDEAVIPLDWYVP